MICNNDSGLVKNHKNILTKWNYKVGKAVNKKWSTYENIRCLLIPRKYCKDTKSILYYTILMIFCFALQTKSFAQKIIVAFS